MLTYDEALARVLEAAMPLPRELVALEKAFGRALAEDAVAGVDLPPFDNSAVDGYAIHFQEAQPSDGFRVTQEIPAGVRPALALSGGEAARIFTGAMLPVGANRIVMQEDVDRIESDGAVFFQEMGSAHYIRRAGSDVRRGEKIITAGSLLDAGAIGLLAALNQSTVSVVSRPKVALLTTGDELIPLGGAELQPGQIRNSNEPLLAAALTEAQAKIVLRRHVPDDKAATVAALDAAMEAGANVIVTSGGVSVGEKDFVREAIEERGTLDFWRIAIKPGKPLAFGRIGDALFFGLPGNPASSLVTFELFVRPVLRKMAGFSRILRPRVTVTLREALPHTPERREFVRARVVWENDEFQATTTGLQGSHRQLSLVGANALLIASENHGDYNAGDRLSAHLLGF